MTLITHPKVEIENVQHKDGFWITRFIDDATVSTEFGVIFIALWPCEVLSVGETHRTAGSDAGSVTLQLEKLTSGQALDAGTTMLQTAFDLKSTANTPVIKTGRDLVFTPGYRTLETGDRLALKDAGTLTALAGINVTVYFKRMGKGEYQ